MLCLRQPAAPRVPQPTSPSSLRATHSGSARYRCLQQPAVRSSAGRSSPQRRTSSSTQFRAYPSRSAALTPACRAPPSASRTQHSAAAVRSSRPAAARSAGPASARKRRAGHSPLRRAPDPVNSTGASRGLQRTAAIMPAEASSAAVLHRCSPLRRATSRLPQPPAATRCAALAATNSAPVPPPAAPPVPQRSAGGSRCDTLRCTGRLTQRHGCRCGGCSRGTACCSGTVRVAMALGG